MIPKKDTDNLELLDKALHSVQIPDGFAYQLPPNSFAELNGEFLNYTPKKELTTKFRIDKKFSNPQGTVQGGIICACFDDTFGPLGVVTAQRPILTIDLNTQYIRPVPLEEDFYIFTKIISVAKTTIYIEAEAHNQKGKLLAKATTNQMIIR